MKFKACIGILVASLVAREAVSFAYQKDDLSGKKAESQQAQLSQPEFITAEELKAKIAKNQPLSVVDLRAQSSFEQSDTRIKGSFHARVRRVAYQLRETPRDREVVTFCACPADEAAILAARSLLEHGFKKVRVLKGGWKAWLEAGGQVESKPRL